MSLVPCVCDGLVQRHPRADQALEEALLQLERAQQLHGLGGLSAERKKHGVIPAALLPRKARRASPLEEQEDGVDELRLLLRVDALRLLPPVHAAAEARDGVPQARGAVAGVPRASPLAEDLVGVGASVE